MPAQQPSVPTLNDVLEQAARIAPTLEPNPLLPVPTPPGWACPGTEDVQNVHVRLGPTLIPEDEVARQAIQEQMLRTALGT